MNETPIEVAEANRLIRAKQLGLVLPEKPIETTEQVCNRLLETVRRNQDRLKAEREPERSHEQTIQKLREGWNAPHRHVSRDTLDRSVPEWNNTLEKLIGRIGDGFTVALVGRRGPGKTQIAIELMRAATAGLRSAYYCTAMDYFMRIKDTFLPNPAESQMQAQAFFSRFKLLVVDEMNVRSGSTWEDNMLADLIGKRYNALLDTVLISNETKVDFVQSVGPSIVDRLNETGGVVECLWKSFRV